ncbi:DNA mismatch repair protein MutS [Desulfoplanes sp.]
MTKAKLTPMLEQYLSTKQEYPDALLFYRMGDFYELFFEDAEIAARELQIALTSRNPNADNPVPMCGVPHHAKNEYLKQLIEKGYKIAVCDQVEDPKEAKGLVRREVTRVLTPGTIVEDLAQETAENQYLAALFTDGKNGGGLAWADCTTGEWTGLVAKDVNFLWQWVGKIHPRELLLPQSVLIPPQHGHITANVTHLPRVGYFDAGNAKERILRSQNVSSLDPLDLADKPLLVQACGAILAYFSQTQKQDQHCLAPFSPINLSGQVMLDEVTERNLELFTRMDGRKGKGTLFHVLDETMTPMGKRLLEKRLHQPSKDLPAIQANQEAVRLFFDDPGLTGRVRSTLDAVYDVERLCTRIYLNRCSPKDFIGLRQSLSRFPRLQELLFSLTTPPRLLEKVLAGWDNLESLHDLLHRALLDTPNHLITEGGLFKQGFDPELDELIELTEHGESTLAGLKDKEQQENNLSRLKLGYNRVFGYYFELSKASKEPVPDHFIRRQTLVNSERYITEELKELEEKLLSAAQKRKTREYDLFTALRGQVASVRNRFMAMAGILARIDYWQGLGHAGRRWSWVVPELHTGLELSIKGGRHPVVEAVQGSSNYIPNDLNMAETGRVLLVTGPNMAGKSTVLRQTALIMVMAQMGSLVPAEKACLGLCDRVFSRVGASDNLAQGQSTFMVEMNETARILRQAGKRSLIILDEIGRGTSTFDGLSLAWAVVEELARRQGGIRTLFATHYHELTSLEGDIPQVRNLNIAVKEWKGDIIFLRRLVPGPADRSYGIEVARLAGVPMPVVQRAREILDQLERSSKRQYGQAVREVTTREPLLPGLGGAQSARAKDEPEPPPLHPIVRELQDMDIDGLTPLEALTLLNKWKQDAHNA